MPDGTGPAPLTAGELIDVLATATKHQMVPLLSVTVDGFFHNPATVHRLAGAVAGVRKQIPAGMDSVGGSLVLPTILVVVNAIVSQVLGDGLDEVTGSHQAQRMTWWARRRLAKRLGRRLAPAGAATPVPALSPGRVALVLAEARKIAVNARLTDQEVDDLCTHLKAGLDAAAGRS